MTNQFPPLSEKITEITAINRQAGFQKAVQAIHISPKKGRLTLVMRRVYNVLLKFAGDKWKTLSADERSRFIMEMRSKSEISPGMYLSPAFTFSCRCADILKAMEVARNNAKIVHEALRDLRNCEVMWNMMRDGGDEMFISGLLSEVTIARGGAITWTYGVKMFEFLVDPKIYQRIDLELQHELRSYSALALYENTARYSQVGSTGFKPVSQWRALLSVDGEETLESYGDWLRRVVKKGMKELEFASRCDITLELEALRGSSGRIDFLKFHVSKKKARSLFKVTPLGPDQKLVQILSGAGFEKAEIETLMVEYEPSRIEGNVEYVMKRIARGDKIVDSKAYVVTAIRENYCNQRLAGSNPVHKKTKENNIEVADVLAETKQLRADFERFQSEQMKDHFFSLSDSRRHNYFNEFVADFKTDEPDTKKALADNGINVLTPQSIAERSVAGSFWGWMKMRGDSLLVGPEETDILVFAALRAN